MNNHIRHCTRQDLPELESIARLTLTAYWPPSELLAMIEHDGMVCYVIADGDIVNGFALTRLAGNDLQIKAIAVHPDIRDQGYGRALIEHLAAKLVSTGRRRLVMHVPASNVDTQVWLDHCRFVQVGRERSVFFDLQRQCEEDGLIFQRPVYDAGAAVIERIMAGEG